MFSSAILLLLQANPRSRAPSIDTPARREFAGCARSPTYSTMLWRISPAGSRRTSPAGFIRPCQPLLVVRPPAGPGWLHEMKHDGYRLIARKAADRVTLWSRYGTDFTNKLPRIAEAVARLTVNNAVLDGEAVVFRPDGHSDFVALRTKAGGELASFVAFDLRNLEGRDLRQRPLEERRRGASKLVRRGRRHSVQRSHGGRRRGRVHPRLQARPRGDCVKARLEAAITGGMSRNWLKRLNPEFQRR